MSVQEERTPSTSARPEERTPLLRKDAKQQLADVNPVVEDAETRRHSRSRGSDVPLAEEPSTAKLVVVMGSVWVGVFLAALDSTVVATLSAPISTSFDSFTLLSWLASAYLIANAALQPLSGRLTDIFSRRTGLVYANIFFAAGNLICGLAKDEWVMILGRVVAGLGGGCLLTISTFVASDLIPLRKRGVWQGFGNVFFGLGSGVGGVYGGWINDTIGWRWAFLLQIPLVILSGCVVFFNVKIPVKDSSKSRLGRVDFLGATTLMTSLVLLLLGLNSGGNIVPWNHPLVYISIPLSIMFLVFFVYVEDKIASEPIIPVRLLLDRTVGAACLTNWFATMAFYSYMYYGPIYFQVRGLSATQAGARLIASPIGSATSSLGSGLIMRLTGKYYILNMVIEAIFVLAGGLLLSVFGPYTPAWPPFLVFFLGGVGYGGMLTITLLALISAVDHKHQAVITSASYAFRSTGSTLGITIASAVFQNILKAKLSSRFGHEKNAVEIIRSIRDSIDAIQHLPSDWKESAIASYMDALHGVWIATLTMCILGAVISLLMRQNVLYKNLERK